jgi:hypothetical protein
VEAVAIQDETLVLGQPSYATHRGRILVYDRGGDESFTLAATFVGVTAGERLGSALAASGPLVVAGAPSANPNGVVRTYIRTDHWQPWVSIASPAISQSGARFGAAVALALDRQWLAVGSPDVDRITVLSGGTPRRDIGAVYIFQPVFLGWEHTQLLRPVEATSGDRFGSSVALHGDVLVAGSPREDVGRRPNAGAAYVFERDGARWLETLRLVDSQPESNAYLGTSVALGDLGALVGAPRANGNGVLDQGAVLFYAGIGSR